MVTDVNWEDNNYWHLSYMLEMVEGGWVVSGCRFWILVITPSLTIILKEIQLFYFNYQGVQI